MSQFDKVSASNKDFTTVNLTGLMFFFNSSPVLVSWLLFIVNFRILIPD